MPFSVQNRDKYQTDLVARCYVCAGGAADSAVDGEQIRIEFDLEPIDFEDLVVDLQERGWLTWGGGGTLRLRLQGVCLFEQLLRGEFRRLGTEELGRSQLGEAYALWLELEWRRYSVWRAVYDAGGGRAGQYIPANTFMSTLGISDSELGQSLAMLDFRDLARVPFAPWVIALTTEGRDQMSALLEELRKHRLRSPKKAAFHRFLQKRWEWEDGKAPPVVLDDDGFLYSDDYLSVTVRGESFALTPRIAAVVRLLHRASRAGTPDVAFERIQAIPGFEGYQKLRDIFKPRHLKAFDALISISGRGLYRLNL